MSMEKMFSAEKPSDKELNAFIPSDNKFNQMYAKYSDEIRLNMRFLTLKEQALCEDWLHLLDQVRLCEKPERNCLTLVLMEQVVKMRELSQPFTMYEELKDVPINEIFTIYFNGGELKNDNQASCRSDLKYIPGHQIRSICAELYKTFNRDDSKTASNTTRSQSPKKSMDSNGDSNHYQQFQNKIYLKRCDFEDKTSDKLLEEYIFQNFILSEKYERLSVEITEQKERNSSIKSEIVQLSDTKEMFRTQYLSLVIEKLLNPITSFINLLEEEMKETELFLSESRRDPRYQCRRSKLKNSFHFKDTNERTLPIVIFGDIFGTLFLDNEEFHKDIRCADIKLNSVFSHCFQTIYGVRLEKLYKKAEKKLEKAQTNYEAKFKERVSFTIWSHKLQMKLVRLKCFSEMRNMFISSQMIQSASMMDLVGMIEKRCDDIFHEI